MGKEPLKKTQFRVYSLNFTENDFMASGNIFQPIPYANYVNLVVMVLLKNMV